MSGRHLARIIIILIKVAGMSLCDSSQGEVCKVNSGSSEQLEFIEPVAHAAGAVDSQDGAGLVM